MNNAHVFLIQVISILSTAISFASTTKAPGLTPAILEKGKASYAVNCLMCHGEKGDGNGVAGALMKPKPRNFIVDKYKQGEKIEAVFKTVTEGMKGTAMAGFGHLPESDRWAISYYILSLKQKNK